MNRWISMPAKYAAFLLTIIATACYVDHSSTQTAQQTKKLFPEDLAQNIVQSTPTSTNIPLGLAAHFNIQYEGAFRAIASGESSSSYAVGTLAFNPDNNSIYMAGHDHHGALAEFEVPSSFSLALSAADIKQAKVLQAYARVLGKQTIGNTTNKITGLLYYNQHLLVNSEIWYDGSGRNQDNMQVIGHPNDLMNASYKGMLQLAGSAKAAGYMSAIPEQWRGPLGGDYLTGWASNYSITSRYSQGPSIYTFNPQFAIDANITGTRVVPTVAKMVFPLQQGKVLVEGGDRFTDEVSPLWSSLAGVRYGFIVPNSSIFMAIGRQGGIHSGIGYKIVQDSGRLCGGGCSKEAADTYNFFWLFDLNDIVNAEEPHNIKPFSYGKWSHPYDNDGSHKVIGGTFDASNNRLFLSLSNAGRVGKYDRPPLILSYQISTK